jgi:hypothetical protein
MKRARSESKKQKIQWKKGDGMTIDFDDGQESTDVYPEKFGLIKELDEEVEYTFHFLGTQTRDVGTRYQVRRQEEGNRGAATSEG